MRALVIEGPGAVHLCDVPGPELTHGEAIIGTSLAGICNTDLELAKGYMGFTGTPGHEAVGKVVDGPSRLKGRRVVGEINAACGTCSSCLAGLGRHCSHRTVLGILKRPGVFAERFSLPVGNLVVVPDEVSDEEAVFAEPVAAAMEILEQVHLPPGERVLVLGDGKLGLLIAQVLLVHGCRVHVRGRHEKKLALARRWGAGTQHAADPSVEVEARSWYRFVVEATGSPRGFREALTSVKPRGTLILKSTYAPDQLPVLDSAKIVVDEITMVGSRCGRLAPALRLLAQGQLDVRSLIDHRKPFEQAEQAFELAGQPGVLKVLLQFTS
jgi:threonine dehydrogenase-like Zn-dependent dehydrogenase